MVNSLDGKSSAELPLPPDESETIQLPGRRTPVQLLGLSWGELRTGREAGRRGKEARLRFRMHSDQATAMHLTLHSGV